MIPTVSKDYRVEIVPDHIVRITNIWGISYDYLNIYMIDMSNDKTKMYLHYRYVEEGETVENFITKETQFIKKIEVFKDE